MMRVLFSILLVLLLFGCVSEAPKEAQPEVPSEEQVEEEQPSVEEVPVEEEEEGVPGIIEVPDSEEIIEEKETGPAAASQEDCSTLSPNCETCVAQKGCHWCKTTNGCYYEGIVPTISSCHPDDWAKTEQECLGPTGGSACSEQTNCASCLSGSGCKWCIQGSVCADASSTEECFGNWMTESFQCNYASR